MMITKKLKGKMQKKKYACELCHFTSYDKKNYTRHCSTKKHKMKLATNGNKEDNKHPQVLKNVCKYCNKSYKHRSGLSRHKPKCKFSPEKAVEKKVSKKLKTEKNKNVNPDPKLLEIIKQQQEQINVLKALINK